MSKDAAEKIRQAANHMEKNLPQVDIDRAERARFLVDRIKKNQQKRKEIKFNPNINTAVRDPFSKSEYFNDLKELLELCKHCIIPAAMKGEVARLRAVADMVEHG